MRSSPPTVIVSLDESKQKLNFKSHSTSIRSRQMQPIDTLLRQIADLFFKAILFALALVDVFSKQTMMIKLSAPKIDRYE